MDEWALVRQAQAGDAAAFAALVDSYGRFVRSLARRYVGGLDAEDAAQEVWLAAYTKLWQVREPSKFLPWLRTLCYYRCLNYRKARARHRRRESLLADRAWRTLVEQVADSEYRVEELLERRELRCLISRELDCLPADYGQLLRLRWYEDLSYTEIARLTGLPLSSVKWRLHDGRRVLRDRLARLAVRRRGHRWRT